MGEESSCNLDGIDKDILKQMELKRREINSNISDLPPSKKEIVIMDFAPSLYPLSTIHK
ncbi:hypothetical protein [Peribacillus butanolivorans]|uniref:hypothetical protein n=1 Tax=Peribacillus butanolivorans TaxID=421767 RepID=UPI0035DBC76B